MSYFQQQVQAIDGILFRLRCYRDPTRIRNDVIELVKNTPSLQPRSGALAKNSANQILYLAGTIPIIYNGAQYNIPVALWIVEAYPFSPPVCYVTPTPDMIIKPKHRHVDSAGMCYLPYLSSWNPNNCNLAGLSQALAKIFSEDPPVRAKASGPTPTPAAQPQSQYPANPQSQYPPNPQSQYPPNPSATSYPTQSQYPPSNQYPPQFTGNPNTTPYGANIQSQYPPNSSYGQPQPPSQPQPQPTMMPNQPYENPAEVAKRNALRAATDKLQSALSEYNRNTTQEIDNLMVATAEQEIKGKRLEADQAKAAKDLGQIDSDIEDLTRRFEDISQWLEQNDSTNKQVDIDAVTEPKDVLSKQLLYLVAEDATIEDTLYYFDKALGSRQLELDIFLKSVRSLATEQFMKRATIRKVHEKQRGL